MIDMYVNHSLVYKDEDGTEKVNYTRYEIRPCSETNSSGIFQDPSKYSCIDDPQNTLSIIGTERTRTSDDEYSFFDLMIDRCNGKNKNCASKAKIDAWTASKQVIPRVLNP